MSSRLTVVIAVKSIAQAIEQINEIHSGVDVIELRLDYLTKISTHDVKALVSHLDIPYILTVRRQDQGGLFQGSEQARLDILTQLMTLEPDYLDIEADVAPSIIKQLHDLSPNTKLIASMHDFNKTPTDLDTLFNNMQHPSVDIYKIVGFANNSLDALRMMAWTQRIAQQCNIVGHCMGEAGNISRISGPVVGNYFIYSSLDAHSEVVGYQVTQQELNEIYFIRDKNRDTKLFALIGNPVETSAGHIFHNRFFHQHGINALYIKIQITADELPTFFEYCHELALKGISVTMPLKKVVVPYIDNQTNINAVNTLKIVNKHITGINTDGMGALNALEQQTLVVGKKLLVIGAGGAATAIVDEAIKRGAQVVVANRTKNNTEQLAARYPIETTDFTHPLNKKIDIVINSIPEASYHDIKLRQWLSDILKTKPVLMNINYNQSTNILFQLGHDYQCEWIAGDSMYEQQARAQLAYWIR